MLQRYRFGLLWLGDICFLAETGCWPDDVSVLLSLHLPSSHSALRSVSLSVCGEHREPHSLRCWMVNGAHKHRCKHTHINTHTCAPHPSTGKALRLWKRDATEQNPSIHLLHIQVSICLSMRQCYNNASIASRTATKHTYDVSVYISLVLRMMKASLNVFTEHSNWFCFLSFWVSHRQLERKRQRVCLQHKP